MKGVLSVCIIYFISIAAKSQNVGIGTTTPQTRLHIVSSTSEALRLDAPSPYVSLYSGGVYKGYFWKSPNSIELGSASGSNLPITFAPNGNQYMQIGIDGNVGIGTFTARAPLGFGLGLGQKISLYDDGNATGKNYGIGIQNGLMQLYAYSASDNIVFGHGSSASFNERMRLVNSGGTGMELNGRIVLKNGTSPLDLGYGPGIWLYKADNSGLLGFMGTQDHQNIGFYGGPAGWGFKYDAINSRVGIGPMTAPSTTLEVNGYTKLGSDAPSIKTKKLTGTTAATQGGFINIGHGLNGSKILSVSIVVNFSGNEWISPEYQAFAGYQFSWAVNDFIVQVTNNPTNSSNILSKPIKIFITYEE